MSWYRDNDGKIITDEEFQSDCCECSAFCSEGTITIPCNGERTDCPHFKEVDTSDYDKETRNKAIDEFAESIKSTLPITVHRDCSEVDYEVDYALYSLRHRIDRIAEQMKEVGE